MRSSWLENPSTRMRRTRLGSGSGFHRRFGGGGRAIRIWTVQPAEVWRQVRDAGEAWVDHRRVNGGWVHPQSNWLAWQMRSRVADSRGGLPWFAYCARPDLRWVRHTFPQGAAEVLIELEPPTGAALAFPCWAWHEVFCQQYLAFTAAERRAWDQRERQALGRNWRERNGSLPDPLQAELEASWLRLFHPELPARSWRRSDRGADREAVIEVIRSEWVRRVREFSGAGAWLGRCPGDPDTAGL